jgi:general secretion pathway protein N
MTRLAAVFLLLNLAAAASASAAGLKAERASFEASRDEAAQAGNPLWAIPLNALTATQERPLFSASRRPAAAPVQAAPPPVQEAAPVVAPAPPERPSLTLIGTIVSPETGIALLRDGESQSVTRLRKGEATSGWLLQSVKSRSIIVEKGERSVTLALPEPLDASGRPPAPNPPPTQQKRSKQKK